LSLGTVLLATPDGDGFYRFRDPVRTVQASSLAEVLSAVAEVEEAVAREGLFAAGFVSYEAGPAFDRALAAYPAGEFPLVWFGLYRDREAVPKPEARDVPPLAWQPCVTQDEYLAVIRRVREYIEAGDTYQVNYTFRLHAPFAGDDEALFARLASAQACRYSAYVDTGRFAVCSASPEMFYTQDGDVLRSRPMKGTRPRGMTLAEDRAHREELLESEKDRAENVMIVDMVRNDLGHIAEPGSVHVPQLFEAEPYPTVWQMTSQVEARTRAGFGDTLKALFPPSSITGAPKPRTTEIIRELETTPRHIYTGAIGYLGPGNARFNVAIRTVLIDRQTQQAEYGVGGGIVWDSDPLAEWEECMTKTQVLRRTRPEFSLLESLLWTPEEGYALLDRHLERLRDTAEYFGYPVDLGLVRQKLDELAAGLAAEPHKTRLLVAGHGEIMAEGSPLGPAPDPMVWRVCVHPEPVDSHDPFLHHKTTHRVVYTQAAAAHPDCDDVILQNERGEITESCRANVVIETPDGLFTPPVSCGLLAGTQRAELLARGEITEKVLVPQDLYAADKVYLINSVRGWVTAELRHSGEAR
jgi:para-aminobenzoate synthetase/4-amino-4-deoxychorismate lyase